MMATRLQERTKINEAIEPYRAAGKLGKSLDAAITLRVLEPQPINEEALAELFIVSQVSLVVDVDESKPVVSVTPCADLGLVRCPRCWRWVPALASTAHDDACPRCVAALTS
jgi:isoleucyl-tRNA synthetase